MPLFECLIANKPAGVGAPAIGDPVGGDPARTEGPEIDGAPGMPARGNDRVRDGGARRSDPELSRLVSASAAQLSSGDDRARALCAGVQGDRLVDLVTLAGWEGFVSATARHAGGEAATVMDRGPGGGGARGAAYSRLAALWAEADREMRPLVREAERAAGH